MTRYVALLRGVNVSGRNKLPMAELRALLTDLGHTDVSTYLQSGNALFTSRGDDPAALATQIEECIAERCGLTVPVVVLAGEDIAAAAADNPFLGDTGDTTLLHVVFLSGPVGPDRAATVDPDQFQPDEFRYGDRAVYLRLLNGVHTSKLTVDLWQRRLGRTATMRNWNTVTKLAALAASGT